MLPDSIRSLILDEHARQQHRFIDDVDLDAYLAKLADHAEIVSDLVAGRCRGFVAFYCNDQVTKQAYITLLLVDPRDRGAGIARALVGSVLELAKRRGFTSCALEVAADNVAAHALYTSLGFGVIETGPRRQRLEIGL